MAANIYDLSTTAGSNTTIDGVDVSGATGKVKDGDNVMRSLGAFTAQYLDDQGGIATTAGTANAQTVTLASGFTANAAGHVFTVKIGSGLTNTSTTVNLNVNSIGNVRVKVDYGGVVADPIPGDIVGGSYATFLDNGTNFILLNPQGQGRYPPGHLQGLTLSNNGSDATNDIDIAVGSARSSDDVANIDLASALTKQLDAAWAVGTNAGMLATGVAVTNTTYYLWLIKRPDTGVVDFAADTSSTGANIAANTNAAYTLKRLIGTVVRAGGVNGNPSGVVPPYGVVSGTYTPTLTNTTNIAASTAYVCQYIRVGNIVWVSGKVDIDPTSSGTNTILGVSLPVASSFTAAMQAGGAGSSLGVTGSWAVSADATNDRASVSGVPSSNINQEVYFSFQYQVV